MPSGPEERRHCRDHPDRSAVRSHGGGIPAAGESEGDIPDLMRNSVVTIDGAEHKSPLVAFGGNATLSPGETHTMRIALSSYLQAGERLCHSQETQHWRWKIRLLDGQHRASLRFGVEEYGPLIFFWDGEQSMNLLQEKPETGAGAR